MLTTNPSLLIRLSHPEDEEAWCQFFQVYQPAIKRSLRAKGLGETEADDAAQQVLMGVAKSLQLRPHDHSRAKFRTWLERIIRNAALNAMRTSKHRAIGGTDQLKLIESVEADDVDVEILENEYRREIFRVAAENIRREFEEETWLAFWRTTVEGLSIDQVAKDLNKQTGSVYAARSRVTRRLREEVAKLTQELD